MNYQYVREVRTEDAVNGISFTSVRTENVNNYQFASMLVNGVQVRVTPFLHIVYLLDWVLQTRITIFQKQLQKIYTSAAFLSKSIFRNVRWLPFY